MKNARFLFCMFLFLCVLTGCKEKIQPEDVFTSYIGYWQHGQYEQMYELIKPAQDMMTKDEFVTRYHSIYEGIEMSNLSVTPVIHADEAGKDALDIKTFPYQLKMDTAAGPIAIDGAMQIIRNKETNQEWKVAWKESLLFPSMEKGDKVNVRTLKAERGDIYDRFGRKLAANGSIEVLGIVPGQLGDAKKEIIAKLAERIAVPESFIQQKLAASWVKDDAFVPIVNVTGDRGKLDFSDLQGVTKREKSARIYPYGEAAAHLTGYIRQVTSEDIEKHPEKRFGPTDVVGKAGMEMLYEDRLRGRDGIQITIVKAEGQVKETLAKVEPVNGENIHTTIDALLQDSIYRSLKADAGTGAAIHPRTGEILALVSSPAYDPNLFIQGLSSEQWNLWNEDPKKPLLNRFTKLYAPGSVFKPITASIGLKLGVSAVNEIKTITGLRWAKDESWGSYYVKRVRDVPVESLTDAIVNSDNIYLAQEAIEIGVDNFSKEAKKFGFGRPLPISYPFPQASLSNNGLTSEILLADSSYGQGEVAMSPLHLALSYTPFINGGELITPVLELMEGEEPRGKPWGEPVLAPETATAVNRMLLEVVENPKGTGHGSYVKGRRIAGKTGTAELKRSKEEKGQENGWFVAYDAERTDILMAVMIEDVQNRGGSAYVVRKTAPVLREYLEGRH
ncbi:MULTISPECIES: penicillin-binding transpeptidase domain-containing protein [unclassified Paenibacillus]|uniref:penicillin-binding transpeptidase domain-containing protein n=1 Tax=unclassified Paenibacillus TaxID=185978 RepID=UPI001AE8342A|nr:MULTISPECIES: penicillin-binding transpeptidase domain-containing protein [unclassified Paenibacillus]MBP1157324.1 penicillin-binding protein [Paenibacillus sp. PvP091]MBP1171937.1 penicillin-binding protein [Paenibacillus sp. PvR098]MBP2438318.1 penicillin-binding protein [Paenibacillus sp. PvP052]